MFADGEQHPSIEATLCGPLARFQPAPLARFQPAPLARAARPMMQLLPRLRKLPLLLAGCALTDPPPASFSILDPSAFANLRSVQRQRHPANDASAQVQPRPEHTGMCLAAFAGTTFTGLCAGARQARQY